uniref:Uncharacterized protein n=1 Tax=Cucumis melo TaxID=3656 RepID=A0A9I9E918_CUCME
MRALKKHPVKGRKLYLLVMKALNYPEIWSPCLTLKDTCWKQVEIEELHSMVMKAWKPFETGPKLPSGDSFAGRGDAFNDCQGSRIRNCESDITDNKGMLGDDNERRQNFPHFLTRPKTFGLVRAGSRQGIAPKTLPSRRSEESFGNAKET